MAKKIEAKDLRGKRRENLIDAFPLSTPWTVFIEPTNACDFSCEYCPTGHPELIKEVGRKVTMMDYDLFCEIIDDLGEFPNKLKMLNLYKDGESLLNDRFIDMVKYAKAAKVSEQIWVKTNGNVLEPEFNKHLVTCGLDMIGISVPHISTMGIQEIAGKYVDYEKYKLNIQDLYLRLWKGKTKLSIKIADFGLSEQDKRKFYDDFEGMCDYIAIEGLHGWSASEMYDWKMGTDQSFDGTPRTNKIACPLVLYMLTINANGDISICNDDFMHAHRIGNVRDLSVYDIWNGKSLRDFRLMHLEGRRNHNQACAECDYMRALPDTIDAHLDELKGKL